MRGSSSPASSSSRCSAASAASRGSYAAPARRSTTARASPGPAAERNTDTSRATCSSCVGSGIASPPIAPGNPWPSQRSKTCSSASWTPAERPSHPAKRCATSQSSPASGGPSAGLRRSPPPPSRPAAPGAAPGRRWTAGRPAPRRGRRGPRGRTPPAARCRRRRAARPRARSRCSPTHAAGRRSTCPPAPGRSAGELAQTDREHSGAQRVHQRLARAEVGGDRQRADHLGGADPRLETVRGPAGTVTDVATRRHYL